ncbi:MAG: helicase-exonuclease AddAB subunit AddA, partial [bacterium]|nr:helicase-exonuclease AddAB subunit AddA [bacterium]
MKFTDEQQSVITTRDNDILVSAAAGSGKTAVLVERIIRRVLDAEKPVNIDQLLVMTFTEAAAAEMKERIGNAIEAALKEQPLNTHLQKQSLLIHQAAITTIHGFCLNVVKNHFHEIDLDPYFRVADEGECRLLKADVMEQILETAYDGANEDFLYMTECYGAKKSDSSVEELVTNLYNFAMSYPFPEQWLLKCKEAYQLDDCKSIEELPWIADVIRDMRQTLSDILQQAETALELCQEPDGPRAYEAAVQNDLERLEELSSCETYWAFYQAFSHLEYARLGRMKAGDGTDPEKKDLVKGIRDRYKKLIDRLQEQYFFTSPEQMLEDMKLCGRPVSALIDLTCSFMRAYAEAKREKNIIDFNDMEHMALEILLEHSDGGIMPSKTAMEYRDYYTEIMVDEYQDSNLVQEYLIRSISKESVGAHNVFMVGDVKQSIYRFRLARPELFMEKYGRYKIASQDKIQDKNMGVRIDLHKNFRSRSRVLNTVNIVFSQIMRKEIGGIDYDDTAALYYGADYPDETDEFSTELLLVETKLPDIGEIQPSAPEEELDPKEAEARAIANRIMQLIRKGRVWDKKALEYRAVRYSDIVILLRTNRGYDEIYSRILQEAGIPTHIASKTGYFTATEVETLLEYLRILDNPLQDIPMAAVMKSTFGRFTDEELATIRIFERKQVLYNALKELHGLPDMPEKLGSILSQESYAKFYAKIDVFLRELQHYRDQIPYTSVYYLMHEIIHRTGYLEFVSAMPRGAQRRANVNMLLTKADDYGRTSYKGLFHFVRYIEYLQKYDVDYGEVNLSGENDNAVRIMSIHKSKGLEFTICILAAMNKKINFQDAAKSVITDIDYGIGVNAIDPILRLKTPTLFKKLMQRKNKIETLAEELRILYVALTRAEEKLIMTAAVDDAVARLDHCTIVDSCTDTKLPVTTIASFTNALDMVLYARHRHETEIQLTSLNVSDLVVEEIREQTSAEIQRDQLLLNEKNILPAEQQITEHFSYVYPHESAGQVRMKVSVSEL